LRGARYPIAGTGDRFFFVRMNNSTRKLPEAELKTYLADRWPANR
jgi:hypothetical protein